MRKVKSDPVNTSKAPRISGIDGTRYFWERKCKEGQKIWRIGYRSVPKGARVPAPLYTVIQTSRLKAKPYNVLRKGHRTLKTAGLRVLNAERWDNRLRSPPPNLFPIRVPGTPATTSRLFRREPKRAFIKNCDQPRWKDLRYLYLGVCQGKNPANCPAGKSTISFKVSHFCI